MPRYIKRIWAGDVYEAKEYFSPRERGMSCERAAKENLSSEEMAEYNCIEARRKCARMVNANFRQDDLFLTLTFRERVDVENALRLFRNFISRLKRLRKRKGYSELKYLYVVESKRKREHIHLLINKMDISMKELSEVWGLGRLRKRKGYSELKYLYVVESKRKREHIHLLINKMDISMKELSEVWGLGRVMVSILEPGGDYTGLAYYITKENYKEYGKRWSGSRNLEKPKVKVTLVSEEKKTKRLRVPKNYKVIEEVQYYSENHRTHKICKSGEDRRRGLWQWKRRGATHGAS